MCGYWPADLLEKRTFLEAAGAALDAVRAWTEQPGRPAILCGSVIPVEGEGKAVRNVAALLVRGEVRLLQGKMLLPFYDVFDEQRYFEPACAQQLTTIPTAAGEMPVAISVCEDAWNDKGYWPRRLYAVDPIERLMEGWDARFAGRPRVILNISASPYWRDKRAVRAEMLGALATRHHAVVAMCNQVGGNDSLVFDGSSLAVACDGRVIVQGASFRKILWSLRPKPAPSYRQPCRRGGRRRGCVAVISPQRGMRLCSECGITCANVGFRRR